MGIPGGSFGSSSIVNCSSEKSHSRSICLLPLMKTAIAVAFEDPHLLPRRAATTYNHSLHSTAHYSNIRLVSEFVKCVLTDIPSLGSPLTALQLVDNDRHKQMFALQAAGAEGLTAESRAGYHPLVIVEFASEWVGQYLMHFLEQSVNWEVILMTAKDIITITQHTSMASARNQVTIIISIIITVIIAIIVLLCVVIIINIIIQFLLGLLLFYLLLLWL